MRTIIIVGGKRYEAQARMYDFYNENDEYQIVGLEEVEGVEYEGRFEPIENLLNKRIEAYEELLAEYETELMHEYRANLQTPFTNDKMREIALRHEKVSNIVDGLAEALGIVVEDAYMVEDVDLSGGEN